MDSKIHQFDELIKWIWVLGGEPLLNNKRDLLNLLTTLSKHGKPIVLFTRFELNEIDDNIKDHVDYIKTGKYDNTRLGNSTYYGIELSSLNQKIWKKDGNKWI